MADLNNKYRAKKTEIDGIVFDSMAEGRRYKELKLLERTGHIKDLELQPEFVLQESFVLDGKKIRPIKYIADFAYTDKNGQKIVEDVKGVKTADYKIKRKMFQLRFPGLRHIETTGGR